MADSSGPGRASSCNRREFLAWLAARASGAALIPFAAHAAEPFKGRKKMLRGVALAGAEFGQLIPGQHGRDYIYPGAAEYARCAAQGFNVVRLPFKWDRLQPDLGGAFAEEEWRFITQAIKHTKRARLALILDPHNYAHRRVRDDDFTIDHLIGSDRVPASAFIAFWRELARRTKQHNHLIYGLMNEPADIGAEAWRDIANATLAAIRDTGATNLVIVPGTAYTGAHSWIEAGNTALEAIRDPADNFAIEVHQYLDADSSGRSGATVSGTIGVERLQAFQSWARGHNLKAFLGEFGAGQDAVSLKALAAIVSEVENNRDVWIGWTAWAAGPWWPDDDPLRLSPSRNGIVPPQMKLLSKRARSKP
ncbi:MAG: glycoside hydrolase family 5 protein [Hyphomicrobium sp.]|nr:glycoside hydrolase family 5 protein [Hyphomicrobium sp.]